MEVKGGHSTASLGLSQMLPARCCRQMLSARCCRPDAAGQMLAGVSRSLVKRAFGNCSSFGEGAHLRLVYEKAHQAGRWGRPRVCGDSVAVTRRRVACGRAWARAGGPGHCSDPPCPFLLFVHQAYYVQFNVFLKILKKKWEIYHLPKPKCHT